MKITTKIFVLSIVFSVLALSNSPLTVRADDNIPPSFEINRLSEGTTLLVDNAYGYRFIAPSGWYPISLPSTLEEIDNFSKVAEENSLPIGKEWLSSFQGDGVRFVIVDLDSKHYEKDGGGLVAAPFTNVTKLMPSRAIAPIIGLMRLSGVVTNSNIIEISDQEVGVVEFRSSSEDGTFIGGKMLLFIRNGQVFAIVGVSNQQDIVSHMIAVIDQIINSLEFFNAT